MAPTCGSSFWNPNAYALGNNAAANQEVRGLFLEGKFVEVIGETERLAGHGQDNSYLRLCRAGAYLWLRQRDELEGLIEKIKEPRGYNQASDIYELYRQTDQVFDGDMRQYCFEPLAAFIAQGMLEQEGVNPP
jgi:hypothetical protein